ncbi:hypothetical protein BDV3_004199 [Batrachochytrium dendrobatidis]|uniref:Phosphatidylinositol-glycan-specific phospholipase D n=1 Tax=Batrachochytrium dendrobatidis (strain JEL423) TaxID=403673 RepID=A0A177WFF7_BATDL|nr:hypothetical protein BDEG_22668 [Batrachochytrium dendrobatidis JEL423]
MATHIEVSHRAQYLFSRNNGFSNFTTSRPTKRLIADMLAQNQPYVQAGSFFPDWGYACAGQADAAEEAHWPPFWNASLAYFSKTYLESSTPQWFPHEPSPEAAALVSFLFGVISHGIADVSWHSLGMDEGFIEAMQHSMFGGSYSKSHDNADAGGDFAFARFSVFSDFSTIWHVPTRDLVAIYNSLGYNVTFPQLKQCMLLGYTATHANRLLGRFLFPGWATVSPFLAENYFTYFRGGINDMAMWVAECWVIAIDWFSTGKISNMCRNMGVKWGSLYSSNASSHLEPSIRYTQEMDQTWQEKTKKKPVKKTKHALEECFHHTLSTDPRYVDINDNDKMSTIQMRSVFENTAIPLLLLRCSSNMSTLSAETPENPPMQISTLLSLLAQRVGELAWTALSHIQYLFKAYWFPTCQMVEHLSSPQKYIALVSRQNYAALGTAMITGDFDCDGQPDLAISAPGHSSFSGAVFLTYGHALAKKGHFRNGFIEDAASVILKQNNSDPNTVGARFGASLAVVDLNQDGIDDLAISAPMYRSHSPDIDAGYDGCIYVLFGHKGSGLRNDGQWDIVIKGKVIRTAKRDPRQSRFVDDQFLVLGTSLKGLDTDGDGFLDLVVGSPFASPVRGTHQRGMVQVFHAKSNHTGVKSYQDADWTISGSRDYEWFGKSLDVQVDGTRRFLLVGAPGYKYVHLDAYGYWYETNATKSSGRVLGYALGISQRPILKFTVASRVDYAQFGSTMTILDNGVIAVGACSQTSPLSIRRPMNFAGLLISQQAAGYQSGIVYTLNMTGAVGDLIVYESIHPIAELHGTASLGHFGSTLQNDIGQNGTYISEHMVAAETGRVHWVPLSKLKGKLDVADIESRSTCWASQSRRMQFGRAVTPLPGIGLAVSSVNVPAGNILSHKFSHGIGDGAVHILLS